MIPVPAGVRVWLAPPPEAALLGLEQPMLKASAAIPI